MIESAALVASLVAHTPEPPPRGPISDDLLEYEETLRRRIVRRVRVDENGCWLWQGPFHRSGYGEMGAFGVKMKAHRVAWTVFSGPIPHGLDIDHLCRNRSCVFFEHLEPVTHAENMARGNAGLKWAIRTHCKNGHPFDDENTYERGDSGRGCRQCRRERTRRSQIRRRGLA
jgi:hypothetical protein